MDDCYKVSTILRTYSHIINPTNGKDLWPKSNTIPILPPQSTKPSKGRKAILRRKEDEKINNGIQNGRVTRKGSSMTCTICGTKGHNKRYHAGQNTTMTSTRAKLPVSWI